jgi:hypothetical protein
MLYVNCRVYYVYGLVQHPVLKIVENDNITVLWVGSVPVIRLVIFLSLLSWTHLAKLF